MEVDGMYQNTPWENLALWAPWIGAGAIICAIVMLIILRQRSARSDFFSEYYPLSQISSATLAIGMCLLVVGILFTILWRPAHDAYPHAFGATSFTIAIITGTIGAVVGMIVKRWKWEAFLFGGLTASVCGAAAISAYSKSIIAEGQVTAMVLPIGFAVAALLSNLIASIKYRDGVLYEAISTGVFLALALFFAHKLPVVQFREDSSLYPVTGAFYIVALGRLSRVWLLPWWYSIGAGLAAIGIGYMLAHWYGLAIAAVGISVAGAIDLRRLPGEVFISPMKRTDNQ